MNRNPIATRVRRSRLGVELVHIFGDDDHAGWLKARTAATRLGSRFLVRLHWPPSGKDFNDHLRARMGLAA